MTSARRIIIICGGGAIGAAIAWFASRRGAPTIVIERHEVGGAASGKSGGFLALDWCAGTPLDALARRSFALHAELAEELGNPWGFRRLTTFGGYAIAGAAARHAGRRPWLAATVAITGRLGTVETTALVEPRAFTAGLVRAAQRNGAELRHGAVVDLVRGADGAVRGVALADGSVAEGDAVVVALGPWSGSAPSACRFSQMSGLKCPRTGPLPPRRPLQFTECCRRATRFATRIGIVVRGAILGGGP